MKILVLIWTYHKSVFSLFLFIFAYFCLFLLMFAYFCLFSLIFLGSDLIIDDVFFFYTFFEISRRFFFHKWYVLSFFQEGMLSGKDTFCSEQFLGNII